MGELVVYCADVGSIKSGNFGWAREGPDTSGQSEIEDNSSDIDTLVEGVVSDLNEGRKVALGFECPLYVPVRDEPEDLTSQREEEEGSGRPWSAGAGAAVLGVGLVEARYVLDKVWNAVPDDVEPHLKLELFQDSEGPSMLLWEAMVTGDAKSGSEEHGHVEDARTAVDEFLNTYPDLDLSEEDAREGVHSLIGSVLMRTGWTQNQRFLEQPCPFVKP
ncbi:MAG: hypothetical protein MAG715_01220 [Methanonatronarchaeales archaeon]|nr:hypothetical protein [Methanonatronarchaeales archaeon]MBS1264023.1 hypothetical protein [Methanonatronarchaeales archaeon]